ncbi:MAG TPA: hypothetical protein VNE42_09725 [Acidimicrobiales bacterium]|nr:hypothetical protein [Acidimicrobiales bacterium]
MKNPQFLVGGLRLDISFIDSSGIWWDRKAGGTLTARSKATDKALRKKQAAQVNAIEPTQAEAGEIDSPVSSSEG